MGMSVVGQEIRTYIFECFMKIAVYTTLFGDYDELKPIPAKYQHEADWILFTDHITVAPGYRIIPIALGPVTARKASRLYKIRPDLILGKYDYTIYLDASIIINRSPRLLVEKYLYDSDIAVLKHPDRDCIYEEMRTCLKIGIADPDLTDKQAKYYRATGYPEHNGLTENGVLIRRNTEAVRNFSSSWWSLYSKYAERDQFSFMFIVWQTGIKITVIPNNIRDNSPEAVREFIFKDHKGR